MLGRRKICAGLTMLVVSQHALAKRRGGRRRYSEKDIPPRFRGRGLRRGAKVLGKVMSRNQLEQCVLRQERLTTMENQIENYNYEINALGAKLKKGEAALNVKEQTVNSHSQESVDDYNYEVSKHRKLVDSYNQKLPEFNKLVENQNQEVNTFNSQCTNSAYYIDDMLSILNKLGLNDEST